MQIGPGIEISMRAKMNETQLVVSNRTLRSAAATRQAKPGTFSSLRNWTGSVLRSAGVQLAGAGADSRVGDCSTVICAG